MPMTTTKTLIGSDLGAVIDDNDFIFACNVNGIALCADVFRANVNRCCNCVEELFLNGSRPATESELRASRPLQFASSRTSFVILPGIAGVSSELFFLDIVFLEP